MTLLDPNEAFARIKARGHSIWDLDDPYVKTF